MGAIASAAATIAGVPALLGYRTSPGLAMERGPVLLDHGFSGTKERMEDYTATETDFLQLIDDTIAEVPSIIDDLLARGWARADGSASAAASLGGNVAYASVLADTRIRAAASVVGSPEWTLPRAHSPHHYPDRFFPAAVLSQSAEFDEFVPAGPVRDFHATLQPWYAREPERIQYLEYPGVGHFLTPELHRESCHQMAAWFQRWLPAH